ncbi:MAG: hypothetical protein WC340_04115 [Kiritimatiellia bacterium]
MNVEPLIFEYQLSYFQALVNPVGGILQLALGVTLCFLGYVCCFYIGSNGLFQIIGCVLLVLSFLLLFARFSGRRSVRRIVFEKDGVIFDMADCMIMGNTHFSNSIKGVPYQALIVCRGIAKTSVLKANSGHYVLVPWSALSLKELQNIIRKHQ